MAKVNKKLNTLRAELAVEKISEPDWILIRLNQSLYQTQISYAGNFYFGQKKEWVCDH